MKDEQTVNDQRLRELLRRADGEIPPPAASSGLAERVFLIRRRRRLARGVGAAAAAVLLLVGSAYWLTSNAVQDVSVADRPSPHTDRPDKAEDIAALQAEYESLCAEADLRTRRLGQFMAAREFQRVLHDARQELSMADPVAEALREADLAARAILLQADRFEHRLDMPESALAAYQKVADLFPQSHWAEVARQRAREIQQSQGDLL